MSQFAFKDPHDPNISQNEFGFSQGLAVHSGAVRSIGCIKGGDFLMSGSIDYSNKMYTMNPLTGKYDFHKELMLHNGFVMNIVPMANGTGFLSAGKDGKILAIDLEGNPILEYSGHDGAVNSLSQCNEGEFVSGSWDGTAKVWDMGTGQAKATLEGHTHAVSVLTLPNGITITGSQDKKIRMWYGGKMEKEWVAHEDIVRGFTEVPNLNGFASCSNDEVVKLWSMDGTHLMDFKGHNGFVFAIDCLETGEIVTGGDDCTVKIWENGACKQTIQLPKTVWSVTHNRHNDILVACENKKVYVFTRDIERFD
jgi:phospholipase A-2-activating protein